MTAPGVVLSLGEFLIDLIATGNATSLLDADTLAIRPGGAPANVAIALHRQAIPAAVCAVVGCDPFGERLLGVLEANGVDRSRVRQTDAVDTTLAFAWKDEGGDGHFRILRQADLLLDMHDIDAAGIDQVTAIVVGSVALSGEPSRSAIGVAVHRAQTAKIPICFDVNMRPALWADRATARHACEPILAATTVLKLSLDDARFLLDFDGEPDVAHLFDALGQYGCASIVLTDGARGAWFTNRLDSGYAEPVHLPAFAIDAVEPTGAGDAFMAATIARSIERNWSALTVDDIRYASAAGALTTTRPGAIASLPTRAEIEIFLREHSSSAGA